MFIFFFFCIGVISIYIIVSNPDCKFALDIIYIGCIKFLILILRYNINYSNLE